MHSTPPPPHLPLPLLFVIDRLYHQHCMMPLLAAKQMQFLNPTLMWMMMMKKKRRKKKKKKKKKMVPIVGMKEETIQSASAKDLQLGFEEKLEARKEEHVVE